jgi:hypothetical protein
MEVGTTGGVEQRHGHVNGAGSLEFEGLLLLHDLDLAGPHDLNGLLLLRPQWPPWYVNSMEQG